MRIAGEPTDKAAAEDRQKGGRKVVENSSKDPPPTQQPFPLACGSCAKRSAFRIAKPTFPRPVQAGIVVCSGFQWVFHPFPNPYYVCLIWF